MRTGIIVLCIITAFISFFSCNNNNDVNLEPPKNYLASIYQDSVKIAEFLYDKRKRVEEVKEFNTEGNLHSGMLNTFDSQNRNTLIKVYDSTRAGLLGIYELSYNADGLLHQVTFQNSSNKKTNRTAYLYNKTTKKVIQEYLYVIQDSTFHLDRYFAYTYNSKGNVIVRKEYEKSQVEVTPLLIKETTYEYDDYSNPYKNVSFLEGYNSFSTNNVIKATVKTVIGEILNETYSSEFTYNEDGYPVMEERLYVRNFDPTYIEYEYIKESAGGVLPTQNENPGAGDN